jgi:hypothetical protein
VQEPVERQKVRAEQSDVILGCAMRLPIDNTNIHNRHTKCICFFIG